jgi:hyperosmotically inducible periplasmic protein
MKKRNVLIPYLLVLMLIAAFAACGSTHAGEDVDDMTLAANVKSRLEADDSLKSFQIDIETRNGVVYLSGWVNSQNAVVRAGEVVQSVNGVRSVKNNLTVK